MPQHTRATPPRDGIVVAGGTIGINGTTHKVDVYAWSLSESAGLIDDTGDEDTRPKFLSPGAAYVVGQATLRGWIIGGQSIGQASVGTGTELAVTLTLARGHTIAGYLTVSGVSLAATKRSRQGIAIRGPFVGYTEVSNG